MTAVIKAGQVISGIKMLSYAKYKSGSAKGKPGIPALRMGYSHRGSIPYLSSALGSTVNILVDNTVL